LCGFAVWTPKGYDWVYRRFLANPAPGYELVMATPFENRHVLDRIADFYERLKESYDESFYQQEVLGAYLNMEGGRVYSAFSRELHITDLKADPTLPLRWALDFNVDPMSSVIVQITRSGVVKVLDEIVIRRATTAQACAAFLDRYPIHLPGAVIYGDASGFSQQTTGASDYDMIREYFAAHSTMQIRLHVPRANPSVRDRINMMNRALLTASGQVGLQVDRKCKELVSDFEEVCFKADTNHIDKDRDRLRTHLSDALGYLVWQECKPMLKIGEKQERLIS
jgi:hypothetical protein